MFSLFRSKNSTRPTTRGSKKAAKNQKSHAFYGDPLPFPPSPPSFNVFTPSTYKSLFTTPASPKPYIGVWCPETRSINVTNDEEGVDIWRRGMWGKGTLSRSQPAWRARKTKEMTGGRHLSLEEVTALKRKERAEFKEERLKKERMDREKQLREEVEAKGEAVVEVTETTTEETQPKRKRRKMTVQTNQELPVYTEEYLDKEVMQIAPEEALFLMHLNLLVVEYDNERLSLSQFLRLVTTTSRPDDPFLVYYIVYYYFRRQRIIVKTGLKFGVDYLLYDRPIPFTHASHCVNVLGNYHLWKENDGRRLVKESMTWQEINLWQRLMGNVRKRLKFVYVEIPPMDVDGKDWRDVNCWKDFESVLQRYRVREVMNSRMVIARERDVKPAK